MFFHPARNKQTIKFQGKTSLFLESLANEIIIKCSVFKTSKRYRSEI